MLHGYTIIVQPDPRRYTKLPDDVQVTSAFRAEFNAWAAEFFQPAPDLNPIKDDEFICIGRSVRMNPRSYAQLVEAFK